MIRRRQSPTRARRLLCSAIGVPAFCEPLEERRLLSTITWTNRGNSGSDTDNFNNVFGAQASLARSVADAAFFTWARVIANLNNGTNNLNINFSVGPGPGIGGAGTVSTFTANGIPTSATMGLAAGTDGHGAGYYLDPTPFDTSEFAGSTVNEFAGDAQAGSPAADLSDFYTLILLETSHCLGFTNRALARIWSTGFMTNTNIPIPDGREEGGVGAGGLRNTYWAFNGPSAKALFNGSGNTGNGADLYNAVHTSGPTDGPIVYNNYFYYGFEDSNNAFFEYGRRYIPSRTDALVLKDAYGYTINDPTVFGTFYNTLDANGTLRIRTPGPGNDQVTVNAAVGNINVSINLGTPLAGADLQTFSTAYSASNVARIVIDTGAGDDAIDIEANAGKPITISGGSDADTIIFASGAKNVDGISGLATVVNGDGGNDSIYVYDNNNTRTDIYAISANGMTRSGWAGFTYGAGVEHMAVTTGTNNNSVTVASTNSTQDVFIYSAGGADSVAIGGGANGAQSVQGRVEIYNSPNFTALSINDTNDATARTIQIDNSGSFGFMVGLSPGTIAWTNNDVSAITITTGTGADVMAIRANSKPLNINNAGGVDNISMGNGVNGMQSIAADVTIRAFYGIGQPITLDDAANTVGRTTSVTRSSINGDYFVSGLAPALITIRDLGSLVIRESSGNDTFAIGGGNMGNYLPLTVTGNGGNDTFNLTAFDNWGDGLGGTFVFPVSFDGGIGYNTLSINDTTRTTTSYQFYANRFYSREPSGFGQGSDFTYYGMKAIGLSCSNSSNAVAVYGVSSDIDAGNQVSISLNGGNDAVTLYPRNAQGNLTINGNVGIGGGAGTDTLVVEDSASTLPITYTFANPFGAGTQNITGMGAAAFGIGSDFESITMNSGAGNDVYNINSYKSGMALTINGALGDDVCNFGNNDVASNVTSIASFLFNGMEGTDTFNLRNATPANSFTYAIPGNTTLQVTRTSPSYFVSLEYYNTEHKVVYAGPSADTMNITSFASGALEFHGAGGDDVLNLPASSDFIGRQVSFFGDAGTNNRIVQAGNTKAAATTLHVTDHTIGAFAGDSFFAPGGSMYFDSIQSIALRMGTGADAVYAAPNATAAMSILGGNPTSAPGDTINLALASAQNYVVNGTPASGSVTSSNLKTLSYSGFESGPNIDATAPSAGALDFNFGGAGGRGSIAQSISVTFSEDVAGLISSGFLSLTNTTTGEVISPDNITLAYDPNTFVATFTFTGYPGGVLPDGAYQAQVAAGYTDLFGNAGAASNVYTFIFSGGTASADSFRVARDGGTLDYLVYLNDDTTPAFVADSSAARIVLSGAEGDDAFIVDVAGITPGDVILDGGAGANSFALVGTAGGDVVAFNATDATINGGRVALANVDTRTYDGAGGYDTLALNAGTTMLLGGSQHFASLSIADGTTALMQSGTNGTIVTRQITMAPTALFDLADNDLLLDVNSGVARRRGGGTRASGPGGDSLAQVQSLINAARNGGTWDGFGITSSTARDASPHNTTLGAMRGSDYSSVYGAGATFNGEAITDDAALVKFTYYGDTDLNGVVNFDDYSRTDAGFNTGRSGWVNGDFDGNGQVDFDDYALIDLAFNTQGSAL